tara:strand:- start:692 stop:889 length:198 start_codon:yes stop_codon:yes gene_type:complete
MGNDNLNVVTPRELKKCVGEILDYLYLNHKGIEDWMFMLDKKEEKEMDKDLFDILNRRINKYNKI